MTISDPRAEVAGKAAAENPITIAAKDPGKGHFYVSLAKSVLRIVGCIGAMNMAAPGEAVIVLALAFLVAEILGIGEELI